ncbi:MAG: 5-formyltetrahydrofolate cyclo-ligase [Thermoprotei archaeon]|nr:MAG: 5-formyltetrahydrofolate cyclo-ligase [Thermoprotei archaeon]
MKKRSPSEYKRELRLKIWRLLEEKNIVTFPRPCFNRIPNFKGNITAATYITSSTLFRETKNVFVNPDAPQRPIREEAIRERKNLVMPTPKLREGFLVIEAGSVPLGKERYASTIRGAFKYGKKVLLPRLRIDLKITGSVAVTLNGARLGKGGGFSDLEYAILREAGLIDETTPVITTVHELQVVDYIPMLKHDVPVDEIYTPRGRRSVNPIYPKPKGIYWCYLEGNKIAQIPTLKYLWEMKGHEKGS